MHDVIGRPAGDGPATPDDTTEDPGMTTAPDTFDPESWLSMAKALGVEVETVTDTFGRVDVRLDRTAMRAFRDAALRHGFADIAAVFSKALTTGGREP